MQTQLFLNQNNTPIRRGKKDTSPKKIVLKQVLLLMLAGFTLCGDNASAALNEHKIKAPKVKMDNSFKLDIQNAVRLISLTSISPKASLKPKLTFDKSIGVPILMIHKVLDKDSEIKNPKLEISINHFNTLLKYIKSNGYNTISLKQLSDFLYDQKPIPEKSIILTFDDGYCIESSIKLLKDYKMHADLGIITNAREKGKATSPKSYYSWEQLTSLATDKDGDVIDLVSHTHTHMYFKKDKSYSQIESELLKSSSEIETRTGKDCDIVIYPGGYFTENKNNITKAISKTGYKLGLTTTEGLNYYEITNPLALKRYEVNQNESVEDLFKQIENDRKKQLKSKK